MNVSWSLLALAIGLAMDAVAATIAQGAAARQGRPEAVKLALAFGAAQALMPLIGWALGLAFVTIVRSIDHWIALVLLGFLGLRMLREGIYREPEAARTKLAGGPLIAAAVATSIDALAAGITLPLLETPVIIACFVIGVVTTALCYGGFFLGRMAGARVGKPAEVAGGLILVALGAKIFIHHQFFGG